MLFLKVTVFAWLLICIYYNRKLGFRGGKKNPLIAGTMPYMFLAIMIYSGITLNNYKILNVAIIGLVVVIIATLYSIHKIKKFYYPINGSWDAGKWIAFPGLVFCIYMLVFAFMLGVL